MKIIIDVNDDIINGIRERDFECARRIVRGFQATFADAIRHGTPLPEHGRLIDADKLKDSLDTWDTFGYTTKSELIRLTSDNEKLYIPYIHYDDVIKCINNAPTVIEGEKKE